MKENAKIALQKRFMFKLLFMTATLLVIAIGFTAFGTSIKYNINSLDTKSSKLQNQIDNLNLKIIANTSPETIESKAIKYLGMEYPSASQYLYIDEDDEDDEDKNQDNSNQKMAE